MMPAAALFFLGPTLLPAAGFFHRSGGRIPEGGHPLRKDCAPSRKLESQIEARTAELRQVAAVGESSDDAAPAAPGGI